MDKHHEQPSRSSDHSTFLYGMRIAAPSDICDNLLLNPVKKVVTKNTHLVVFKVGFPFLLYEKWMTS